jgi:hypothetical protein
MRPLACPGCGQALHRHVPLAPLAFFFPIGLMAVVGFIAVALKATHPMLVALGILPFVAVMASWEWYLFRRGAMVRTPPRNEPVMFLALGAFLLVGIAMLVGMVRG